ncbi:hypothetical protein VTN49DRAFT_6894 [Thermomyces lanuginosus]|uniref:uncharacterized protein n=1 Tax=Thermomyces lanuginosus TaxID=5541 RepID=UPI00374270C7
MTETKNTPEYTFTTRLQPPPLTTSTTILYPTPENPDPATNDPVFSDGMRIRHAVFVEEQHCSAENEIDSDDERSWQWVIYASKNTHSPGQDESNRLESFPVGIIRLVPPPHAPHEALLQDTTSKNTNLPKYDFSHEPYVKITRLAVLPDFRGHGLSKLLLRTAEDWARDNRGAINEMLRRVARDEGQEDQGIKEWNGLVGLHAQVQVEEMYRRAGYETDHHLGTWYEEGILHVGMFKRLRLEHKT